MVDISWLSLIMVVNTPETEIHEPYENKTEKKKTTTTTTLHARKRRPGTNVPKVVKYKSPSRSKRNN